MFYFFHFQLINRTQSSSAASCIVFYHRCAAQTGNKWNRGAKGSYNIGGNFTRWMFLIIILRKKAICRKVLSTNTVILSRNNDEKFTFYLQCMQ